jgi:protein arginine kinase activator
MSLEGMAMNCQSCHKNFASVRYAEVVDGIVKNLHVCQECLDKMQQTMNRGFEYSSPSPFQRQEQAHSDVSDVRHCSETCVTCGTTLQHVIDTGFMGCSDCYTAFSIQTESILEGIHSGLLHRGKIPRQNDMRAKVRADLQSKRALLKSALGSENYEDAAALRDEIQALEAGLISSESGAD